MRIVEKARFLLMKCGHIVHEEKVFCMQCGLKAGSFEVAKGIPSLRNRFAYCLCGKKEKSDFKLKYFQYGFESKIDRFYCGECWKVENVFAQNSQRSLSSGS